MSILKAKTRAYSLLEIMVTVAIIGLLVGIAVPIYTQHINKAQAADALNTLSKLELAGKLAYEENQSNTVITYANTEFNNNIVTSLNAEPVVNGLYVYPDGLDEVADNQFIVCVYVGNLNFTGYVAPTPGVAGTYSRICKKVTASEPIYTVICGALDGSTTDVPLKYLPSTCQCANVLEGAC